MKHTDLFYKVECVSCFDNYVLEYFIDGAFVHIEKTNPITINVKYVDFENEDQQKEWYDKNIYSLPLYQKFMEQ